MTFPSKFVENVKKLVEEIKKKESLSGISSKIIESEIEKYSKKNNLSLINLRKKDEKIIIQDVRAILRKMSGSFTRKEEHASVKEREEFYDELREKIYSLKIDSILDLGCGLNPMEIAKPEIVYYCYDIDESAIIKIRTFFKENKISGEAFAADIQDNSIKFPAVDLCILFKVLDLIDKKGHKNAETLIKKVNSKYFLISFPTKTLSGRPMKHPQRGWIERLITRLGFSYEFFKSKNEIFYLASKESSGSS